MEAEAMSILKEIKLARLKRQTRNMDARPFLKMISELSKEEDEEKREKYMKIIEDAFHSSGEKLIELALLKELITEEDLKLFKQKGFKIKDIGPVLQGFLQGRKTNERAILLTSPDSVSYKHRKWIEERFNVFVKNPKQVLKLLKKIDKQIEKESEKECKL